MKKHRFYPAASSIAVMLTTLIIVSLLYRSEQQRLLQKKRLDLFHQLNAVSAQLEVQLRTRTDIPHTFMARVAVNPDISAREFSLIARDLMSRHTGIRSIQLARNSVVTHIYPLKGNEAARGLRLLHLPGQSAAVRRAIETKSTVIAGPLELAQGGIALVCRTPIYLASAGGAARADRYWGLATVVIDQETLFHDAGLPELAKRLQLAIRGRDGLGEAGETFFGDAHVFSEDPVKVDVTLQNGSWQLAAVPRQGWQSFEKSLLWLWIIGFLLAFSAGGLTFFLVREPIRLRRLLDRNRLVEQSLRLSEEKYRAVVDHANEGIAVGQDGYFRFVNPAIVALLGYSREELLSRPFADFIDPADRDLVMARHRMRLRGESLPPVYSIRVFDRHGEKRWLEINSVLISWDDKPAALTFLNDITERKIAEERLHKAKEELEFTVAERTAELRSSNAQLAESERNYRRMSLEFHALLDSIADAMIHIAPDFTVLWANKAAAAAVGTDGASMIGKRCHALWFGVSEPCAECPVSDCFRTGRPQRVEKWMGDGRCRDIKTFPLADEDGQVVSVIEIAADITERIKFQNEASRTRQLVSLGELAAGVAHEINNPLAGTALCFKELMQPDLDAATRGTLARVIDAELGKMKAIVDRLLTFSRMTVTRKSPVNLNQLVESMLVLCRYQFGTNKVAIVTELAQEMPQVLVDESKMEQVFINIMLNALHVMREGGRLLIRTDCRAGCCSVAFEDTGPGITSDILPRIFDPFFTTRGGEGGTGLGLSISKEIVEQHGGVIEVDSRQGEGATFIVKLPMPPAGPARAGSQQDRCFSPEGGIV